MPISKKKSVTSAEGDEILQNGEAESKLKPARSAPLLVIKLGGPGLVGGAVQAVAKRGWRYYKNSKKKKELEGSGELEGTFSTGTQSSQGSGCAFWKKSRDEQEAERSQYTQSSRSSSIPASVQAVNTRSLSGQDQAFLPRSQRSRGNEEGAVPQDAFSSRSLENPQDGASSQDDALRFNADGLVARIRGNEVQLPWSDWETDPDDIEIMKRPNGTPWSLGQGGFGTVYKATWKGVTTVAVKVIGGITDGYGEGERSGKAFEDFRREVLIMRALRDKHIVQFLGASLQEGKTMLVLEHMEAGDLFKALRRDGHSETRIFSWYRTDASGQMHCTGLARRVAVDIARGLAFLHARGVVHFDLKSSNILLGRDFTAKLADIGLAKILRHQYISQLSGMGTFCYAAPEVLLGRECNEKVDIYSFGVIMWELATLEAPLGRRLRNVKVPEECPQEVVDLIHDCLSEDPDERPTAIELVQALTNLTDLCLG